MSVEVVNSAEVPADGAIAPRKRRQRQYRRRRPYVLVPQEGKWGPLTRENLDRRTLASKKFDALVAQIRGDCGDSSISGDGNSDASTLTAVQVSLIESFAAVSVQLDALTVHLLLGEDVDPFALCALSSTLTRIGSRLGLQRKAKTVETPALRDYLDGKAETGESDEQPA
jgi:hypothetical protein